MQVLLSPFESESDNDVKTVLEGVAATNIHRPAGGCLFPVLSSQTKAWQQDGSVVVFSAGVFDILHVNHLLGLTHFRLLGAREYWIRRGVIRPTSEQLHDVAASDAVRLILSVDSDARVAADKGFVKAKGDCAKPLVSWDNRALLLARQQISRRDGSARPLIDFITSHGIGACTCVDCPHLDNAYIARDLEPDIVVVNRESSDTLRLLAERQPAVNTKVVLINEGNLAYRDYLLDGPVKSSAIIKRAKQPAARRRNAL